MKTTSLFSSLTATLLLGAVSPINAAVLPRDDASTIANFGRIGICMSYFTNGPLDKELAPCKTWCPTQNANQDPNAVGCQSPGVPVNQIDPSTVQKDDNGNLWTPGTCVCSLPVANALLDIVIQALSELDDVICAVMVSAVVTLVEEGLDHLPGGTRTLDAVKKAVKGAKTFAENGLDAKSYFDDWIGAACMISNFDFDLDDIFSGLEQQPDSLGVSAGCFKAGGTC
ncbi:hypothetical protein F5B19DRAFT_263676 [Rostrohypoxylon terebratum]|nr:hypothetical protein F5B19DRAFT_263676 [Rostrohypoxylon terebratum]